MTLPTSWTTVPVFGTYLRTDGSANQGAVWFELDQEVQINDDTGTPIAVLPRRITAVLDADGHFVVHLPATDDPHITPTGWTYQVSEKFNGGAVPYSIEVPRALASTGINLVQYPHATPVPVNPPVVTYLTTADLGVTVATQGDVTTALGNAANAVTLATAATTTANNALTAAGNATTAAANAQTTADNAVTLGNNALSAANAAAAAAATAQSTANGKLDLHGTADAAVKWATARTVTLAGDASGSVTLNGTADATLTVDVTHADTATTADAAGQANQWTTPRTVTLSGDASGSVTLDGTADEGLAVTVSHAVLADSADVWSTPRTLTLTGDASGSTLMNGGQNESIAVTVSHATAADSATTATNAVHATDATKWATARTITLGGDALGSVSIDGSANATLTATVSHATAADTATSATSAGKWTTPRTLALTGDVTGSVAIDGSANASIAATGVQAAKLTTARTISMTGDVIGSASFDGSADISIPCTVSGGGGGGGSGGWKNYLINGDFDVWQRGTNFNPVGPNAIRYTADRWQVSDAGEAFQITRNASSTFLSPIPDAPNQYIQANMTTAAAGAGNFTVIDQKIPGLRKFSGKTLTLSFWVAGNTGRPISSELIAEYGTGGSPGATVTGLAINKTGNLTTTITKVTVTATMPAFTGTYGTNGDDGLRVRFWLSAGSNYDSRTNTLGQMTTGVVVLTRVQLEAGSSATAADLRPYALELAMCQRFYEKSFDYATAPAGATGTAQKELGLATSTTSVTTSRRFKVAKRVAPTVSLYASADGNGGNPNSYVLSADGSTWTPGTTATSQINETGFNLTIAGTSLTAGAAYLTSGQWEADAELP